MGQTVPILVAGASVVRGAALAHSSNVLAPLRCANAYAAGRSSCVQLSVALERPDRSTMQLESSSSKFLEDGEDALHESP
jgi:hypothetical protein